MAGKTQEQGIYYVVKANDMIQKSRFSMPLEAQKIILYLISKIRPTDTGTEIYTLSIREFNKICGIDFDNGKNYIDAKKALKTIADTSMWIKQKNGSETLVRWLNHCKFNADDSCFEITFHEDILPYLYNLHIRYTRYYLENVLYFQSKFSIRLYELLKSYEYKNSDISFTLDELRERLDAQNYTRFPDLRRFVLYKAIEDINAFSDIKVGYMLIYSGKRAVKGITFTINPLTILEQEVHDCIINEQRHKREIPTTF